MEASAAEEIRVLRGVLDQARERIVITDRSGIVELKQGVNALLRELGRPVKYLL